MKEKKPVMPELLGLVGIEKEIYSFALENWPTTPIEIAKAMQENLTGREQQRRASTKYAYYIKKLVEKKLLLSKKAGNSIIVWPLVTEKYRTIHNILKHHEAEHLAVLNEHHKEKINREKEQTKHEQENSNKTLGVI